MRHPVSLKWLGLLLLALPACQTNKAKDLPPLKIDDKKIRIGVPAGPESTRSRNGHWCPVYVTLKAGKDPITRDMYRLVVKSTDVEDAPFRYSVAVPALNPEDSVDLIAYTRPGHSGSEVEVQLVSADGGRVIQSVPRIPRDSSNRFLVVESREPLLLEMPSRSLRPDKVQDEGPDPVIAERNLANIDAGSVAKMPDQWFGYEAVDVVVLTTGNTGFMNDFVEKQEYANRREALYEWVRRGGRLILTVGSNTQHVAKLLEKDKFPVIDCKVDAAVERNISKLSSAALAKVQVATITPGEGVTVLAKESDGRPVLMQASCGLGRVMLVAVDVEKPPFTIWTGFKRFWDDRQIDFGVRANAAQGEQNNQNAQNIGNQPFPNPNMGMGGVSSNEQEELLGDLQRSLEDFGTVATVSFGWVALFLLLYIGLIGPLDYFVLKKVFKRLELTWITFPATVVLVSVTSYLIAYACKGDVLRVQKVDLVEIDLHDNTSCGTTWFSLFSPRIQTYTLGVEPVSPAWVAPPSPNSRLRLRQWSNPAEAEKNQPIHPTMVTVLSNPNPPPRRQSLTTAAPPPYDYTEAATAMENVPIPVWAVRSFTATWTAPLPKTKPPIQADLRFPRAEPGKERGSPLGEIVNNLPVPIDDVVVLYNGKIHTRVKQLPPDGQPVSIDDILRNPLEQREEFVANDKILKPPDDPRPRARNEFVPPPDRKMMAPSGIANYAPEPPYKLLKRMMNYDALVRKEWSNAGARNLDHTWRIKAQGEKDVHRDEVILIGRIGPKDASADEVTSKGFTPTALWLGRLPGTTDKRPKIDGSLRQETYIRVYIPVKPNNP
jgi:hypothetical protein